MARLTGEHILDEKTGQIMELTPERLMYLEKSGDNGLKSLKKISEEAGVSTRAIYNYRADGDLLTYIRSRAASRGLTLDRVIDTISGAMDAKVGRGKPDHSTRLRAANMAGNMLGYMGPTLVKQMQIEQDAVEEGDDEASGVITVEEVRKMQGGTEEIIRRMTERKTIVLHGQVSEDENGRKIVTARSKRRNRA